MKILLQLSLVGVLVAALSVPLLGQTALARTENAGWFCDDVAGAWHCFDPGDGRSKNTRTINVRVFDYDGEFLGTEQIWTVSIYAGQPCPQDELLDLGFGVACHHYSH